MSSYNPEAKKIDPNSKFTTTEQTSWGALYGRLATGGEKCLMYFGVVVCFIQGATFPVFMFIWGSLMDDVGAGTPAGLAAVDDNCNLLLIAGAGAFVLGTINVSVWNVFADLISYKTRILYFRKSLERDAAFYDEHNPMEMATKISREVSAIKNGLN